MAVFGRLQETFPIKEESRTNEIILPKTIFG